MFSEVSDPTGTPNGPFWDVLWLMMDTFVHKWAPSGAWERHWVTQSVPKWTQVTTWSGPRVVNVGQGERSAEWLGSAEGGEASPPSLAKDF